MESHIPEVFTNTLPTKLCWVLFPTDDLRQAVETAKRILTKEKIDRQLAGQLSSTPFMSIRGNYTNKKVTFDTQDGLEDSNKLTVMMSKLAANKEGVNKQIKPKIYQNKKRGQTRNFYDTCNYQNRYRSHSGDRRVQFSSRIQYGQTDRSRPRYAQGYRNDFRRGNFRGNARPCTK